MQRISKKLAILLSLILLLSAVGCKAEQPKQTGEVKKEEQKEAQKPVTLKFYSWESYFKDNNEKVIKAFQEKNPNINVEVEYVGDGNNNEYLKKIDLMLLSGQQVDIVMQANFVDHIVRATAGVLEPLDDFMKAEGVKYEDIFTFNSKIDGKAYGFPGDVKSWFVMINKNHLDEAGLPLPPLDWTWEDYREYAKKLTKGEGKDKRYGSYFHSWADYNLLAFYTDRLDNPFVKKDGSLNFDDPLYKEFMKFRYDMENVDKCSTPYFEVKSLNLNYRNQFYNEKISMLPVGSWMISEIKNTEKYPHDFITAFAPLPRWSKESPKGRTITEAMYYCVTNISKFKEEAYKFIKFYTTDGMSIKGTGMTAQKGGDKNKILDIMMGENPSKLYDVDSLKKVFNNPDWFDNVFTNVPKYHAELKKMFVEESEKYLVNGISLDEAMKNIQKRAQEIADKNK